MVHSKHLDSRDASSPSLSFAEVETMQGVDRVGHCLLGLGVVLYIGTPHSISPRPRLSPVMLTALINDELRLLGFFCQIGVQKCADLIVIMPIGDHLFSDS